MTIKQLREKTGLSQSGFAYIFGIPVRTIQKWERNGSTPAPYIPAMINRIMCLEEENKKLKNMCSMNGIKI